MVLVNCLDDFEFNQYVDCAKQLTRHHDPAGYVKTIALMAQWTAQFNYADLPKLILD